MDASKSVLLKRKHSDFLPQIQELSHESDMSIVSASFPSINPSPHSYLSASKPNYCRVPDLEELYSRWRESDITALGGLLTNTAPRGLVTVYGPTGGGKTGIVHDILVCRKLKFAFMNCVGVESERYNFQ